MSDDILYVVEHIEAELQRLGRLVATLRRRIEAQSNGLNDSSTTISTPTSTTSTVSGPAPQATPMPRSAQRTVTRGLSDKRFPAAAVEEADEESMVRTASGGSSYGFVRDRRRDDAPEQTDLLDDSPLDRRTR